MSVEESANKPTAPRDTSHYPTPVNVLVREWPVVKGAPVSFLVCLIVCGALIWLVIDRFYSAELRAKDATIQTLSLRPESTKEIEGIRAEIKVLRENEAGRLAVEWPPLSTEKAKAWVATLAPFKLKAITVYWNHTEGAQFYASLVDAFKAIDCKVLAAGGSSDPGGFSISAYREDPAGPALLKLLNDSGYRTTLEFMQVGNLAEAEARGERISIFLGPRI